MHNSKIIFIIDETVRAIACSYEPEERLTVKPKTYHFKTVDPTICVGDLVVVPTDTRHCMTVVRVEEVDIEIELDDSHSINWVVSRVDREQHNANVARETAAIAAVNNKKREKKRAQLRKDFLEDVNTENFLLTDTSEE